VFTCVHHRAVQFPVPDPTFLRHCGWTFRNMHKKKSA
jgi:hypothetical protein